MAYLNERKLGNAQYTGIATYNINSNTNAKIGRYLVDTTAGSVTLTLPASPNTGDVISIVDIKSKFDTNNCVVSRNGKTIMGMNEDLELDRKDAHVSLVYSDGDWRIMQ